jgi:hypothetical protein
MPRDHICFGRVMSLVGPSRRWRSPELAGCWGSSAALGPQGATYAAGRRGGNHTRSAERAPGSGGRTEVARAPSGGPGGRVPAIWRRASVWEERKPGERPPAPRSNNGRLFDRTIGERPRASKFVRTEGQTNARFKSLASVEVLESVRRQGCVDRSARDRSMAKPSLDCPRVVALVGEGVAAGVAEQVRVRL